MPPAETSLHRASHEWSVCVFCIRYCLICIAVGAFYFRDLTTLAATCTQPPVVPALFFVGRLRGMLAICVPAEALTRVSGDEAYVDRRMIDADCVCLDFPPPLFLRARDAPVNACVALDARTQRDHGSASTLHGIEWTAMRRCGGARGTLLCPVLASVLYRFDFLL